DRHPERAGSRRAVRRRRLLRPSVIAIEDEPAECPQADLELRVGDERIDQLPRRFDQLACLALAGVEHAAPLDQRDALANGGFVVGLRLDDRPQPTPLRPRQLTHCFRDRRGDLSVPDVLATALAVLLEAAQVQHVIDDLERDAERFEQAAEPFGLRLAAAADERRYARERAGRRRRLQTMDREYAPLQLRAVAAFDDAGH